VPADYPNSVAADWPELLAIVEERVKPERSKLGENTDARRRKKFWWQWGRYTPGLYQSIRRLDRVLTIPRVTKHVNFSFLSTQMVMSEQLIVFAFSDTSTFGVLQSRAHEIWANCFGSSLGETLRYGPSDIFETFPFPANEECRSRLEEISRLYFDFRAGLMITEDEGMTDIYNRFHNPEEQSKSIVELRRLHDAVDRAVLDAYGWSNIKAAPVFEREWVDEESEGPWRYRWPELTRDEVLARLLALNAARAAEETRQGMTIDRIARDEDSEAPEEFELEAEEQ
jgi:hypothetical protein